jgi:hypothetical protein
VWRERAALQRLQPVEQRQRFARRELVRVDLRHFGAQRIQRRLGLRLSCLEEEITLAAARDTRSSSCKYFFAWRITPLGTPASCATCRP